MAAAKTAEEDTEAQNETSMKQDTIAAGEPHEPTKVATWRNLMVPRGPVAVPEMKNEMGATTRIEAGDITNTISRGTMEGMESEGEQRHSQQMVCGGKTMERMGIEEEQDHAQHMGLLACGNNNNNKQTGTRQQQQAAPRTARRR